MKELAESTIEQNEKDIRECFKTIKTICSQYNVFNADNLCNLVEETFGFIEPSNYIGGVNDTRRTLHENIFAVMYPNFKKQVTFGTGKNGYKKYGAKKYTVDFIDEKEKIIYEIDGCGHNSMKCANKDFFRDLFFEKELGIRTVRLSNKEVEKILKNVLYKMNKKERRQFVKRFQKRYGGFLYE